MQTQELNASRLGKLKLELSKIKHELAEVNMMRDFKKKCAVYQIKQSRNVITFY